MIVLSEKGYDIRTANDAGGKAGRDKNRTSTLQVTFKDSPSGYLLKKQVRYIVGDGESYQNALVKCLEWIAEHPLKPIPRSKISRYNLGRRKK
jgi:hypothetical protein